jgi:tetratricopeptide (TPR) repeat protein
MKPVLKIVLYAVLVPCAWVFGHRFFAVYAQKTEQAAYRFDRADSTNVLSAAPLQSTIGSKQSDSALGLYAFLTLVSVLGFGFLFAHDATHYVGHRVGRELFNEEGESMANPEYDQAEQVWADGDHLEAIRLMREYLKKNPREVHAALRIAEIYEGDLNNHLAAALEYEEILQQKLSPERWGWAAIHLCNLYYRLDKPDKAEALLRRIVKEHGQTGAAKKARERLGLPEDEGEAAGAEGGGAGEAQAQGFKLPPGFRPKKT